MKTIAIHQSQYIPWSPYLKKMAQADIFVVMDNVQYHKNGVQNRNQIRNKQGAFWLTIPVTGNLTDLIIKKKLANDIWKKKHWKSIKLSYAKAPFWSLYSYDLSLLYDNIYDTLGEVNKAFLNFLITKLEIETNIYWLSDFSISGRKNELILNICKEFDAETYLSGAGANKYLDEKRFEKAGIKIEYINSVPITYKQYHHDFINSLSIIDVMFNLEVSKIQEYLYKKKNPSNGN